MIIPENKLCPVPPVNVSRVCAGELCAWFLPDKRKCAIAVLAEEKAATPKQSAAKSPARKATTKPSGS